MRATSIVVFVGLLVLLATPILGAPSSLTPVAQGEGATYALSFSLSLSNACFSGTLGTLPGPCLDNGWSFNGNGTFSWNAENVTQATAILNDTVMIGPSEFVRCIESCMKTDIGPFEAQSFHERIDLNTRLVTFLRQNFENAYLSGLMSQNSGTISPIAWNASIMQAFLPSAFPIYTMWWVNPPLAPGDNVTVLAFPTRVNGTRTVDLGSLGTRHAWTLSAGLTRMIAPMPCAVNYCQWNFDSSSYDTFFAYDQSSARLLESSIDFHSQHVTYQLTSSGGTPTITTVGYTLTGHVALTLVSERTDPPWWPGPIIFNPNPSSPPSSSNYQAPTSTSNQASPVPTLLATIGEPRNMASVAIVVAVVGLLGLAVLRRARLRQRPPPKTA